MSASDKIVETIKATLTFLKNRIDTKANDEDVVKLTGTQTIAGTKTFSSTPKIKTAAVTTNSTYAASTAFVNNLIDAKVVKFDSAQELTSDQKTQARANIDSASSGHTHATTLESDSGTASITLAHGSTYKLTSGGTNVIFKMPTDNNTTYSSKTAASGGTDVSLVTTGEKYTWNNKSNLAIGTTATTAAAGNHTHTTSLATDSGTSSITLAHGSTYKLSAGGTDVIFTMPTDNNSSTRKVGEIVTSTLPISDVGLHLLDGSIIQGDGVYSDFVDYIADLASNANYSSLFVTESNWQSSITSYGVCGKFVYDSTANTVRLPKITGIVEGTTDVSALGSLIEAGLPNINLSESGAHTHTRGTMNITGHFNPYAENSSINITEGAFYYSGNSYPGWGTSSSPLDNDNSLFYFDASRSWTGETSSNGAHTHTAQNSIYGKSTTVQPQTIKVLYYIVIAETTAGTTSANINSIVTKIQSFDSDYDQKIANFNSNYEEKISVFDGSNYLPLSGGTVTGSITYGNLVFGSSNTTLQTPNIASTSSTDSTRTILFGIGSGGENRGVYDAKLGKWMVYANDSQVYLNGHATSDLPLSGGTLTGNLDLKWTSADASKSNNNVSGTEYPTTLNILDNSGRILTRMESIITSGGDISAYFYARNYNTSGSQVAQKGIQITVTKSGGSSITAQAAIYAPSFQSTSDIRKKSNLVKLQDIDISSLNTYEYDFEDTQDRRIGLIAQEVEKILPTAVKTDTEGFLSLDYNAIVAVLVNKVNELTKEVNELKKKL